MQLTIGKIRGLAATSSEAGVFTFLVSDHQQSLARILKSSACGGIYSQGSKTL